MKWIVDQPSSEIHSITYAKPKTYGIYNSSLWVYRNSDFDINEVM